MQRICYRGWYFWLVAAAKFNRPVQRSTESELLKRAGKIWKDLDSQRGGKSAGTLPSRTVLFQIQKEKGPGTTGPNHRTRAIARRQAPQLERVVRNFAQEAQGPKYPAAVEAFPVETRNQRKRKELLADGDEKAPTGPTKLSRKEDGERKVEQRDEEPDGKERGKPADSKKGIPPMRTHNENGEDANIWDVEDKERGDQEDLSHLDNKHGNRGSDNPEAKALLRDPDETK